jgi:hypothetical protein
VSDLRWPEVAVDLVGTYASAGIRDADFELLAAPMV